MLGQFTLLIAIAILSARYLLPGNSSPQTGAERTLGRMKWMYSTLPDYRQVSPKDFPHIPKAFYDRAQAEFERLGFRFIADLEDVNLTRQIPEMRTFLRLMVSSDGSITAAIFDFKPRGFLRVHQFFGRISRDFRTLELETEFANGAFLAVCTAEPRNLLRETPGILRVLRPRGTPPEELIRLHQSTLASWQRDQLEYKPLRFQTLQQMIESSIRQREIKNRHRQATGLITRDELRTLAGDRFAAAADKMMDEIEKLEPPRPR